MSEDIALQILELARWAPSGDNTQPWRFEVLDARRLVVHGHDTRDYCVYDLDGHPSQMSIGALLETMAIAASTVQLAMVATRREQAPDTEPTIDVSFLPAPALEADPLADYISEVPGVDERALLRKARKLIKRKVINGCDCGCPGYYTFAGEQLPVSMWLSETGS